MTSSVDTENVCHETEMQDLTYQLRAHISHVHTSHNVTFPYHMTNKT